MPTAASERAAMLSQLSKEAQELRKLIQLAQETKRKMKTAQTELDRARDGWERAYASYESNTNLKDVVVTDVFEGVIAEKLKEELPEVLQYMLITDEKAASVSGNTTLQINNLDSYILVLQSKLDAVVAQMASLQSG